MMILECARRRSDRSLIVRIGGCRMKSATTSIAAWLARPLLLASLSEYRRDVTRAVFPADEPEQHIEGSPSHGILFVGDVGVMGYGVLWQGMTVCARVAHRVAAHRQQGLRWSTIAAPDLTLRRALKRVRSAPREVDVIVLMCGVPDILLATTSGTWSAMLSALISTAQHDHPRAHVLIAGMPPLQEFRPVPARVYRLIADRVAALNVASSSVAAACGSASYIDFPHTAPGALKVQGQLSWATLHETWADVIVPAVLAALGGTADVADLTDDDDGRHVQ